MDHKWGQEVCGNPWYVDYCIRCQQRKEQLILECDQEIERKALLKVKDKPWFVYILLCLDGTLYTGITNNLWQRLRAHKLGKGAKYTKQHKVDSLVYQELLGTKSDASKREYEIKQLTKLQKLELIKGKS